ncbi:coiled-coil domain-containing protein 24-like isoform X2 [Watersipora subatra]|uniref:coiled-coil domain-containing protein 24-like isoform X2 n=1 Tax=Watersipora subatra TaxID=2589382 RepID=UPI00355C7180
MMTNSPDADVVGYNPPLSLWRLVEQHVSVNERDEIKNMLGGGVVDETQELHDELQTFLDIWRDCRQNEESKSKRLPEPPGIRDRLIQEIKFFVENVREKAQEQGRDETTSLQNYNENVINYAVKEASGLTPEPFSRPQSILGRDGRDTPSCRQVSPSSDRVSTSTCTFSTLSEDVEAMAEKLNILKIDEVVQHLRSYLCEERELLVQDLRFLQECIEEENDHNKTLNQAVLEPTIGELREERLKLEKEMLSNVFAHQKALHGGNSLKPSSGKTRSPILPSSGPLKAVHSGPPDGIVLAGNVPESVVVKTQQKLHEKYIDTDIETENTKPTSASARPSSAMRFRSMVQNARSTDCD